MVKTESVKRGIAAYLDSELMPQIPNGDPLRKFGSGVVISLAISGLDNAIKNLSQNRLVGLIGLTDGESVDLDSVIAAAKANMPEGGLKIALPVIGELTFHAEDADKLADMIARAEAGTI